MQEMEKGGLAIWVSCISLWDNQTNHGYLKLVKRISLRSHGTSVFGQLQMPFTSSWECGCGEEWREGEGSVRRALNSINIAHPCGELLRKANSSENGTQKTMHIENYTENTCTHTQTHRYSHTYSCTLWSIYG